jgi:hypothetical protein
MAASAKEKDFAHQLHKHLCEYQGDPKPKLIVRNLLAASLPENRGRFEGLANLGADLVVIQMGDNLPPAKANKETLRKPYELLIKSLRRGNPDAIILGVSTWGGGANRDPMMEKACRNQNVPFVRIGHFIRDEKNKAASEGRFEHSGVNWHPGDRGMKAIADTIWKELKPLLGRSDEQTPQKAEAKSGSKTP